MSDSFERLFDAAGHEYLYLDKKRLVRFTAEERDAYVSADRQARLHWSVTLGLIVLALAAYGVMVMMGERFRFSNLPFVILCATWLADYRRPAVRKRLAVDAAGRSTARTPAKTEITARLVRQISWPMIALVLSFAAASLLENLTAPTRGPFWWIATLFFGFVALIYVSLGIRKAFPIRTYQHPPSIGF